MASSWLLTKVGLCHITASLRAQMLAISVLAYRGIARSHVAISTRGDDCRANVASCAVTEL